MPGGDCLGSKTVSLAFVERAWKHVLLTPRAGLKEESGCRGTQLGVGDSTQLGAGNSTPGDKEETEEECIKIRQSERRTKSPKWRCWQQLPDFGSIRRENSLVTD